LQQIHLAHLQQRRERVHNGSLLVAEKRRVRANGLYGNARREQIPVRVQNVAPVRGLTDFFLRPLFREARQFVMAENLQFHEPVAQPGERYHDKHQHCQHPRELLSAIFHPKTASRPWRSVPQPTASRAAAKI
jgi:hypothetical protein